ncbi:MAG: DUF3570 domain-containing protein [Pseudomonadota bacterium]
MAVTKKSSILARLSCAALSLPAIAMQAQAARIDEEIHTDFQLGHYSESDQRMEIDIYEVSLSAPVGEKMSLNLGLIKDVISGASPMFNIKDADGNVKQILSGASIKEERNVVDLGMNYYFDQVDLGFSVGVSEEYDYLSEYMQTGLSWDLNNKMTTLFSSLSLAWDDIEPTGKNFTEKKKKQQLSMGLTQILSEKSLFSSNLSYSKDSGYLSDPYKSVFFTSSGLAADFRPDSRYKWSWLNRYIYSFAQFNHAALHFDYRFYHDSWDINAHTFEIKWHQPINQGWELVPRLRYYSQDAANFYQPYFNSVDNQDFYSSDYRMANFGAISMGLNITKELYQSSSTSKFDFRAGIEYYDRKASYQLGSGNSDNFADYDSYLMSVSIKYSF